MSFDKLPFNWFDIALLMVLFIGIQRGRKNGMSQELLSSLQWLVLVFACAFGYAPVADFITSSSPVFSAFTANLMAYFALALLVGSLFTFLKKAAGGKLVGSDVFGNGEFYLGMVAGMVRFTCILLAGLALLNCRYFSPAEIKAEQKYQNDVYGSDFFPSLYTIQSQVFEKSFAGPWIKKDLQFMLIKPTTPEKTQLARKQFSVP
ncbi:MAG: CvpA family protein [Verrucomicrobiota bacterium]